MLNSPKGKGFRLTGSRWISTAEAARGLVNEIVEIPGRLLDYRMLKIMFLQKNLLCSYCEKNKHGQECKGNVEINFKLMAF